MNLKKLLGLASISIIATTFVYANDGATLYKKCSTCHGAMGEKKALGKSIVIKDMTRAEFVASLKGYRTGQYGGPMKAVMVPQTKNLSDEDIEKLADHIIK